MTAGFREFERRVVAGSGAADFERLRACILGWGIQRGAGLEVRDAPTRIRAGATARLVIKVGPLRISGPLRVTDAWDAADRAGFSYETLPGHPEDGEESFVASLASDGVVTFTIRARSRPGRWWSRLGAPLARILQDRATERYLATAIAAGRPPAE